MTHSDDEPITVRRLERCLDRLCQIMAAEPDGGTVLVPLYNRLLHEIALRQSADDAIAAARARAGKRRQRAPA